MLKPRNCIVTIALAIVLAGCGGSGGGSSSEGEVSPTPPTPSAVTGDLEISVVGLPSGILASVVVTGPDNFSETITQSVTLDNLVAGDYSITVSPSDSSGIVYDVLPMTRQVTINAQGASETLIFQAPTISEGIISNFGSVFVNGVRFDTSDTTVSTDESDDATEDDLDIGMVVTVVGRSSADGSNAQASDIQYRVNVEGPVERVSLADETVEVLGQIFQVDELTQFPTNSFERLIVGNLIEISAFQNQDGEFVATRINLEEDAGPEFRIRGSISDLNEEQQRFELNGISVDFSGAEVDGSLANGSEVSATAETAINALQFAAVEVEVLDIDTESGIQQAIDGVISEVVSATQILVGDYTVNIDENTEFEVGSSAELAANVRLRVFGFMMSEDVLTAQSIRLDPESDIALTGRLDSVDDDTVEVLGNEYEIDEHSILQDLSEASVRQVTLGQLSVGDLIEISAFESDDELIIRQLSRLSVDMPDTDNTESIELEGEVNAVGDQSFSIQGVMVSVSPFTVFDFDDEELTLEEFNDTLAVGDRVEVEGLVQTNGSVVATSVELEDEQISESSNVVELEGDIGDVTSSTEFMLNGRQILIDVFTDFEDGNQSDLVNGNSVEVRGRESEDGRILALRVEFESIDDEDDNEDTEVGFEGTIGSVVSPSEITVSGQTVIITDETELENGLAEDLLANVFVEVEGNLTADGTVEATSIEFEDADDIEISGSISSFVSSTQFFIGAQEIGTNDETEFDNGNSSGIAEGVFIEVSGELVNGVLIADEIEFESVESAEVEGVVSSVISESQFTIEGQSIVIDEFTELDGGEVSDIEVGVFLEVEGRLNDDGVLIAESIEFEEGSDSDSDMPNSEEVEVSGLISSFISPAQFFIDEQEVSTNDDTEFDNGDSFDLAEGVSIEVSGILVDGVLIAEQVEFTDTETEPVPEPTPEPVQIEGPVSSVTSASQFTIQGQVIVIDESTEFEGGEPDDIEVGVVLDVEGSLDSSGVLVADSVEFPE